MLVTAHAFARAGFNLPFLIYVSQVALAEVFIVWTWRKWWRDRKARRGARAPGAARRAPLDRA